MNRVSSGSLRRAPRLPVLALLLAACTANPLPSSTAPSTAPSSASTPTASPSPSATATATPTATPAPTATPTPDPVAVLLARMSVDEKIGQLLMPYAYGASADAPSAAEAAANRQLYDVSTAAQLVARYHLGGVILLPRNTLHPTLDQLATRNTTDPARVPTLTNGLQRAALDDSGIPLLIATDQEEGLVTRIREPLTLFPGAMPLGATGDPDLARRVAAATGRELADVGVNLDLAPDADVNVEPANPVIGIRSFGDDPALVSRMVAAQVAGYQEDASIGAAAKHFPGHGDTSVDSHVGLPVIGHDSATLDRVDLPPFEGAIRADVDVVMAGHLLVPALDPKQPATLSRPILTGLLRDRLGFGGVVMTDSLWMAGIRSRVSSDAEAALDAFLAGADVLLMPPDLIGTVARFRAALRSGALGEKRLDASVERILRLKQRLGLLDAGWYPHAALPSSSTLQADATVAREAASAAVTLVACRSLPRLDSGALVVGFDAPARALAGAIPGASSYAIAYDPSAAARAAVLDAARSAKSVILLTYDAGGSPGQRQLAAQLAALAAPLIAVSIDLPYDVALTGAADARLATYGSGTISMRGLATTLLTNRFAGRLPVAVGSLRGGLSTCR